jgi:phosphotransferase system  glucose/maltose/N-acetylglucosamine-specific IIC component
MKGDRQMLIIVILCIIFILFVICIMTITLSDTETFKAIDRKIANKINEKEKKK